VLTYFHQNGIRSLVYSPVPAIYHRAPAGEDRYALFLAGARWVRCGMLSVVDQRARLPFQERRLRAIRKAVNRGLSVARTDLLAPYWELLSQRLREAFDADPVHSLDEITLLRERFPEQIKLYGCFENQELRAGILTFDTGRVARMQYIASDRAGREAGAVDLLFDHLLNREFTNAAYVDLGTSHEGGGRKLNEGLVDQKEGFGARAVPLDRYLVDVASWRPGTIVSALL
jgi:hypothetical protein